MVFVTPSFTYLLYGGRKCFILFDCFQKLYFNNSQISIILVRFCFEFHIICCFCRNFSDLSESILIAGITFQTDGNLFGTYIILNKQVLVQRKANGENDSLYIRNQLDLAQKTLHVVKGSPSILRIQNLGNEIGDTIYIKEIEKYGSEQLISLVAHGDIDYAVCDESIARAVADSLPQVDINTAISFTQFYSWAVSKQSPALLDSLNTWLDKFQKEKEYQKIYRKYYGDK